MIKWVAVVITELRTKKKYNQTTTTNTSRATGMVKIQEMLSTWNITSILHPSSSLILTQFLPACCYNKVSAYLKCGNQLEGSNSISNIRGVICQRQPTSFKIYTSMLQFSNINSVHAFPIRSEINMKTVRSCMNGDRNNNNNKS